MDSPIPPREPPHRVRAPTSLQRWHDITFLHWSFDPDDIQRLLPDDLQVETLEGRAWVGLTPFEMRSVRVPGIPAVPRWSSFPETNLRTYVRGPDDRDGVWFFSLDAASAPVVAVLRMALGLPYVHAAMSIHRDGQAITYDSDRRSARQRARCRLRITRGATLDEISRADSFLTSRWAAYSRRAGVLVRVPVEHPPWPLARASVTELSESVTTAAGLPEPGQPPLVHFSEGVDVRIGAPRPLRR